MAQRLAIWQSSAQKRLGNHQRGESGVPGKAGAGATKNARGGPWGKRPTPFGPFRLARGHASAPVAGGAAMNRLSKFAWHDVDGAMHLDVPAMLKELGMADTPENRD